MKRISEVIVILLSIGMMLYGNADMQGILIVIRKVKSKKRRN